MPLDGRLDVAVTGDAVEFTFAVTNADTEPVDLEFRSGEIADVAVYEDGTEVWRWSDGRVFAQTIRTEALAPGESFTQEATWEDPPPGEYAAEASLSAANVTLAERSAFAVP